jgi:hypothetical protein
MPWTVAVGVDHVCVAVRCEVRCRMATASGFGAKIGYVASTPDHMTSTRFAVATTSLSMNQEHSVRLVLVLYLEIRFQISRLLCERHLEPACKISDRSCHGRVH